MMRKYFIGGSWEYASLSSTSRPGYSLCSLFFARRDSLGFRLVRTQ